MENNYQGLGVFTHAFKLTRSTTPPTIPQPRLWNPAIPVPEESIIRPLYKRGREVMTYRDHQIFHSAPDFAYRMSTWRFM